MAYEAINLMAGAANGVQVFQIEDYPDAEFMSFNSFMRELPRLDDGEVIFTQVLPRGTDGEYETIEAEYGIN